MFRFASSQGFLPTLFALSICITSVFGAYAITGTHTSGVQPRHEIRTLKQIPDQWNIYLLALQAFQAEDQSSLTSWYQIAGIHGVPYIEWDGVKRTAALTGYCVHSSNLFPTWHRPYVALYEQRLTYHARAIAQQFKGSNRQAMITAADQLRAPFWDWAEKPANGQPVLPPLITSPTAHVTTPSGPKTIKNPLFSYSFHPKTPNIFAQPWNRFPETLRYPTSGAATARSQNNQAVRTFASSVAGQRSSLYQWFTNCKEYNEMSNDEVSSASPGCHISLESLHNNVHVWLGGSANPQGHMTIIPYSAFDPTFMLHHTQIDRLFAMWQELYPGSFTSSQKARSSTYTIQRGSIEGPTSDLKPFHSSASGKFWTSNAVRNHRVFGYTYQDFLSGGNSAAGMRARINKLYGPNASIHAAKRAVVGNSTATPLLAANGTRYEWIANIATSRFGLNGTYTIYMFLGNPASEDPQTWAVDAAYAGSYGVFSQAGMTDSPIITTSSVCLTVPLTNKVQSGMLQALDELIVIPYLTTALTWRVIGPSGTAVDPNTVPDLLVSVVASTTTIPTDPSEFPVWSEFVAIPEITHGKPGGLLQQVGTAIGQLGQDIGSALGGSSS